MWLPPVKYKLPTWQSSLVCRTWRSVHFRLAFSAFLAQDRIRLLRRNIRATKIGASAPALFADNRDSRTYGISVESGAEFL